MDADVRIGRTRLFQELKPTCVQINQVISGEVQDEAKLARLIKELLALLDGPCRRAEGAFDQKLADCMRGVTRPTTALMLTVYATDVFFPLSQILRRKQSYRLTEAVIKCLRILLGTGWRHGIALDLGKQLLILLTLLTEDEAAPEEVRVETLLSLSALFRTLNATPGGAAALVTTESVPALGHTATTVLDSIAKGPVLSAMEALESMWLCIRDADALSNFLPATVSALVKLLAKKSEVRTANITRGLTVLEVVLLKLLSDINTRRIRVSEEGDTLNAKQASKAMTKSWLKATLTQIKLALANVLRLKTNRAEEVRSALASFCITLIEECHDTLTDSLSLLVENLLALVCSEQSDSHTIRARLCALAILHPDIAEFCKTTVYNWVTGLPRIMQSNDQENKQEMLRQISEARAIMIDMGAGSSIIDESLFDALHSTVVYLIDTSKHIRITEAAVSIDSQALMTLSSEHGLSKDFGQLILSKAHENGVRMQFDALLNHVGSVEQQSAVLDKALEYLYDSDGDGQVAAYWLAHEMTRTRDSDGEDEFLDASLTTSGQSTGPQDELHTMAVSILNKDAGDASDWRMQAISLEIVAETAGRLKNSFRTELMDVLYPIAQLLGSSFEQLRHHAIVCLNLIAMHCGYLDTKDLIIQNVDYMVNAVAIRLNTFDISPQAPQVLVMMIRLAGPTLLVYLDDVVEAIFGALDNFHGYQLLVESLFAVLGEIVQVGASSNQLLINSTSETRPEDHTKQGPEFPSIQDIVVSLKWQASMDSAPVDTEGKFPSKPWKEDSPTEGGNEEMQDGATLDPSEVKPTPTAELLRRITLLSQHYLTHASPTLRARLLYLIDTSLRALPSSSPEFLPLINDIYPVLAPRLYDPELFVVLAACDAMAAMCDRTGDFMATRLQDEWPRLMRRVRQCRDDMLRERKTGGVRTPTSAEVVGPVAVVVSTADRGVYAPGRRAWEALLALLSSVIGHVRVSDPMLDVLLDEIGPRIVAVDEETRRRQRRRLRERTATAAVSPAEPSSDSTAESRLCDVLDRVHADRMWFARWRCGTDVAGDSGMHATTTTTKAKAPVVLILPRNVVDDDVDTRDPRRRCQRPTAWKGREFVDFGGV